MAYFSSIESSGPIFFIELSTFSSELVDTLSLNLYFAIFWDSLLFIISLVPDLLFFVFESESESEDEEEEEEEDEEVY